MTDIQKKFQRQNPLIFSQWQLNCLMRTKNRRIDMTKLTDAIRKFTNTPESCFYIAQFIYRLQTTRVQKDSKSTAYNYVREWVMYRKAKFCCLFVLHTYTSLIWNLNWHISVHA